MNKLRLLLPRVLSILVVLGTLAVGAPAAAIEPLTVRVDDAISEPGGLVAIVLRTYASRPAGQGQVCLNAAMSRTPEGGTSPFVALEDFLIFAAEGDATGNGSFDPVTGEIVVDFESPSATINQGDGPILAIFMRLDAGVSPGDLFDVVLDLPQSFLLDPNGLPIPLISRSGELEVRAVNVPTDLSADGDSIPAGLVATLGVGTSEPLEITHGRVRLLFDPDLVGRTPVVSMDPRHGDATFTADVSVDGRIDVEFFSDGSLGYVPGQIVSVEVLIPLEAAIGEYPLVFDPVETSLTTIGGEEVLLENDLIEILPSTLLFADGFESGDVGEWSAISN